LRFSIAGDLALDKLAQPLNRLFQSWTERAGRRWCPLWIRSVYIAYISESDDVLAWLAGALARHALVGVRGRRASNMGSGEKDDTVVVSAEAEIEAQRIKY
jgi:hypothetical protein